MNVKKKGILPKKIKKLQNMASKKKSKDSAPSYKDSLDEVTVTAKAPTEAEKAGAKAFVERDEYQDWAYVDAAAGKEGSKGYDGNWESAKKLKKDTANRLKIPTDGIKVRQTIKRYLRKKAWKKGLEKTGYRK